MDADEGKNECKREGPSAEAGPSAVEAKLTQQGGSLLATHIRIGVRHGSDSVKAILKFAVAGCLAAFVAMPGLAQDAGQGEAAYKLKCVLCHGADGKATTPAGKAFKAASFGDPAIVKTPDADLMAIVKKGKDKMPAFGGTMTDDQIKSVIAYIRTLQK
jgi:mono/diheme cytochrome c family protein